MTTRAVATPADDASALAVHSRRRRSPLRWLLWFARRKPLGFIGLVLVVGFVVLAAIAPAITPFDATKSVGRPLLEPRTLNTRENKTHWLGTDANGQDVLSRVMQG